MDKKIGEKTQNAIGKINANNKREGFSLSSARVLSGHIDIDTTVHTYFQSSKKELQGIKKALGAVFDAAD